MSQIDRLAPTETRKLLALAAVAVQSRRQPPEIVAVIRTDGAPVMADDRPALVRAVVHRLLQRNRVGNRRSDDSPLVLDLDMLRLEFGAARTSAERALAGLVERNSGHWFDLEPAS